MLMQCSFLHARYMYYGFINFGFTIIIGLSSSAAAGISVAITVPVTAIISVIITIIIMHCLVYGKHNKQSYTTTEPPEEYETPIKTTELEMSTNTAYGQIPVLEMSTNTAYGQIQYKPIKPPTATTSGTVYDTPTWR